jgi:alpha-1,3-glucosyltransferase
MRITQNEPLDNWYFDDYSIWTLDYPPMFAYFEYLLAKLAVFIDPEMISVLS